MSDPYTEATRDERTGMSTLAKVFLFGGGLVVAALVALFIWFSVSVDRMLSDMQPPPPPVEVSRGEAAQRAAELQESRRMRQAELEESRKRAAEQVEVEAALRKVRLEVVAERVRIEAVELARVRQNLAAAQESVAGELSRAVNTVMESAFDDAGFSVEPVGAGTGLSFNIRSGTVSTRFDLVSDPEMLDRVSRGEGRLADLWPDEAAERGEAAKNPLPEWVPVFPGADRKNSLSLEMGDLALGVEVFLADASGNDILLWYFRASDRLERDGTDFWFRQLTSKGQPDPVGELGRFAMGWQDRQVSVFVTEDDHGDSLFVVIYKGDGRIG